MGYLRGQKGIYEMENVHGVPVAGATYAVPIWYLFMRSAEYRDKPREFLVPDKYPEYRPFTRGHYGSFSYTPSYDSEPSYSTTEETTTEQDPTTQAATTQAAPPPKPVTQQAKPTTQATPPPAPPPPAVTTTPPATTEPPPPPPPEP
jgi:hypothetical protein